MKFVTEKAIAQYFGLIRNNMLTIKKGKHKDTPREAKLFYQVSQFPLEILKLFVPYMWFKKKYSTSIDIWL